MAVKIRLRRMGQKKDPFYRIVVADSQFPERWKMSSRRSVPTIRTSNRVNSRSDEELAKKWLANGAQPTEVVGKLFKVSRHRKIID